jgi:uncharacterized membrane protein (DUF2068 family)
VVWYLIIERGLKGLLFVGLGIYLLTFVHRDIGALVDNLETRYGFDSGHSLIARVIDAILSKVAGLSPRGVVAISSGLIIYGLVEFTESVGLVLRRRWAEYLVVVATAFGIPIEIREVLVHFTVLRSAALLINIAVVGYLIWRKRLFILDEPEGEQ